MSILPEPIIGVDAEGRVELWNPAATAEFGWAEEDVLGNLLAAELGALRVAHFEVSEPVLSKAGTPVDVGFHVSSLSGVEHCWWRLRGAKLKPKAASANCSKPYLTPSSKSISAAVFS